MIIYKEMLSLVYMFDTFWSYLVVTKVTVYIDHATIRISFSKKDAKTWIISWILLLQKFDLEFK